MIDSLLGELNEALDHANNEFNGLQEHLQVFK